MLELIGGTEYKAGYKHRTRTYTLGENVYTLDKRLDGQGGIYYLYQRNDEGTPKQKVITMNGLDFWGAGLTWRQAEARMTKRLLKLHELYAKIKELGYY